MSKMKTKTQTHEVPKNLLEKLAMEWVKERFFTGKSLDGQIYRWKGRDLVVETTWIEMTEKV